MENQANAKAIFSPMKFGLNLPPQQRVYGGFFVYSFCMGSLPPRLPDLQRMMQICGTSASPPDQERWAECSRTPGRSSTACLVVLSSSGALRYGIAGEEQSLAFAAPAPIRLTRNIRVEYQ